MTLIGEEITQQWGQDNLTRISATSTVALANLAVGPAPELNLALSDSQIQMFDNMCYQLTYRFDNMPVYVDPEAEKRLIVESVADQYASAQTPNNPSIEPGDEVRYTLASCLIAGTSLTKHAPGDILKNRAFFKGLFSDAESKALLALAIRVNNARQSYRSNDASIDSLIGAEIEKAQKDGTPTLFQLALQAYRIGVTIENPELTAQNLATFIASLRALQP